MTFWAPEPQDGEHRAIVFDLDNTLAHSVWPDRNRIGDPIHETVEVLRGYAARGFTIYICTARREVDKPLIWEWVKKHKLPVDGVQAGKKILAALYVDDRAWCPPWLK